MHLAERSTLEILLFAALIAVSLGVFLFRLGRVARLIWRTKPDPGFVWEPLGRRFHDVLWEVFCQAKVIHHRPLVGLAHAVVFWGFCAFLVVTANHIALGFGEHWFDPDNGDVSPFYFYAAYLFSIGVSIAIVGLSVRRFLLRPKWLGAKLSPGSAAVALLILVLMITYAIDYQAALDPDTVSGETVWWIHSIALFTLLPLIAHTKHLHLLLGPVSVFLSRGGFSRIPPLAGDEDFGLVTGKDITRVAALQTHACVECGRCMEHCPAYNTGKILNPKEIALGFRSYLRANGPVGELPLCGPHLSQEAAFQCTTCGACETLCPVGVEHLPLIVGLRRGAVNTGAWADERGAELFRKLERHGNPFGFAASERDRFIAQAGLPFYDGTQEYVLWLGCMGAYDPLGRETVLALVELLRFLDIRFGVLRRERCSGDAARRLGNDHHIQQLAEFNIAELQAVEARKILSICPHCVQTIGQDWRDYGARFDVQHHSVLLSRYAHRFPEAPAGKQQIVLHDPCYLGRYQGKYYEPRRVAALAGELVEAPRSRDTGFCCGAGGGMTFLGEEQGTRISQSRARELVQVGAPTVATACPFCKGMLRDALASQSDGDKTTLVDVAQLAVERLRKRPSHSL
jgi:Fe-S oxidoreductase